MNLYNTLSRQVEEFAPQQPGPVKMYTCGLTVYSQPQIGNWAAYIYSDILTRTLLASGLKVKRVQNITDVGHLTSDDDSGEDKMEKGAQAEGLTAWDVADKYIKIAEREAYDWLGLLRPDKLVRATDLIPEQIDFIQKLETQGFTYQIDGEGIYFDTSKLQNYGQLARLDIKGLQAGARVEVVGKKNITDFALWKFSPSGQQRDMEWQSPWGLGFPGWHLECSVIAYQNLGPQIDLHTGGIDHIPVHHTNEIAQTESLTGLQFSRFWFHNNFIKINDTKLSKSLNNSYTLQDVVDKGFELEAFKLMVLSSHYRTEGNFSWQILEAAQNRLNNWRAVADLRWQAGGIETHKNSTKPQSELILDCQQKLLLALGDDLDTPLALSLIDQSLGQLEAPGLDSDSQIVFSDFLSSVKDWLGIDLRQEDISSQQQRLITKRQAARQAKDWARSDQLRDELKTGGIELNDHNERTTWYRSKMIN